MCKAVILDIKTLYTNREGKVLFKKYFSVFLGVTLVFIEAALKNQLKLRIFVLELIMLSNVLGYRKNF